MGFTGDIVSASNANAWYGTPDHVGFRIQNSTGAGAGNVITPMFTCDPRQGVSGHSVGDKILERQLHRDPRRSGIRTVHVALLHAHPVAHEPRHHGLQELPDRQGLPRSSSSASGAFNLFNQAVPGFSTGQDLDLRLKTACNVQVNGVPNGSGGTTDNVCDPTGGFHLTDNSIQNFGKIILQRGHRVIEFALKFYF